MANTKAYTEFSETQNYPWFMKYVIHTYWISIMGIWQDSMCMKGTQIYIGTLHYDFKHIHSVHDILILL